MTRLFLTAALSALLALLLACGDDPVPTPRRTLPSLPTPTPAQEPTPTRAPAPTPQPTATPPSTATPMPEDEPPAGAISPLALDDPEAIASELSDQELACLAGVADIGRLLVILSDPAVATPEEQVKLLGCLNDEIVARIFLAGFVPDPEPLSLETSACIRAALEEIDPRAVMTAGLEGDPATAMAGSMAGLMVTLACLNQEEWETTAPHMGMDLDEQEGMVCVLEETGGPAEMAAAMIAANEGDATAFSAAAVECGLDTGPLPGQTPPARTATPEPGSTPEPSSIAPLNPDDPAELFSRLSQGERDCITDFDLLADFWPHPPHVDYEDVAGQMACLEDETLLDLHLANIAWYFQDLGGTFRADTASCIRESLEGIRMGDLVREAHTAVSDLTLFYCLSEEEAALAAPDSGLTDEEYDGMICTVDAFGGLEEFTETYRNTDAEEFTEMMLTNLYGCPGG